MLVAAKCPNCGANIKVNPSYDSGICNHCGTAFITKTAINNYNTTNITNNHFISDKVEITSSIALHDESVLIKRIFNFIEIKDWKKANEYCEKVLDINPENSKVYLAKLFIDLKIRKIESLKKIIFKQY